MYQFDWFFIKNVSDLVLDSVVEWALLQKQIWSDYIDV